MSNEVFSFQVDSPLGEEIRYLTVVSESESGREQRYQKWQKGRRSFRILLRARELDPRKATAPEAEQIWSFYRRHKGSFDTFLFQSPNENPVTAETAGSGDGVKSVFYVGSKVDVGTGDLILTPGSLTLTRSVGGTGDYLAFSTGDYTVDEPVGQITTNSVLPSGDVLRATYNHRYRVRFREDNLSREVFTANLCDYPGIELIEVI